VKLVISHNRRNTKFDPDLETKMMTKDTQNPLNGGSQNAKAKSPQARLIAQLARFVRKEGLTYEDWRYVSRRVRSRCDLHPAAKPKKLPRVLTADQFRAFYKAVDEAKDVQHALMLRLLFFTAVRVSELCNIEVADVDLENCKIRVNQGKGSKDRFVLFGKSFATALRTHIAAHPTNRWLFQTRRCGKFSTRRVQQVVKLYAEQAGVIATPHTFRHYAASRIMPTGRPWLTWKSLDVALCGLCDAA